jgi:hypothetical protein
MKSKGNVSLSNFHYNSTSAPKDNELAEMSERIQKATIKNDQRH